jgi:hypothetical protein
MASLNWQKNCTKFLLILKISRRDMKDLAKKIVRLNFLKIHFFIFKLIIVREISSWMMKFFH